MNQTTINLTGKDIEMAIIIYLKTKYPDFVAESMLIEYNQDNQEGKVEGHLKSK